jgi:hypothetical protein
MRPRGELSPEEERLLGYNRPSPEDEEQAAKQALEEIRFRREQISLLMNQRWFRQWLWERLSLLHTFDNLYAVSPSGFPDTRATDFYHGQKAAGWDLWTFFDDIVPEQTSLMRREAMKPKTED